MGDDVTFSDNLFAGKTVVITGTTLPVDGGYLTV